MATDLVRRLMYEGLLSEAQASAVVARRAMFGEPAPVALTAVGAVTSATISDLFERLGFMTATRLRPSAHARQLPKGMLRTFWVLPIGESPEGVVVAMVDPTDAHALRELRFHLRRPIDARVTEMDSLRGVIYELDPPADTRQGTRPAPGAVPPADDDAQWSANPSDAFAREVVGMVKPRERTVTPPYGQPVVQGGASAWGHGRSELVRLDAAPAAIGAFSPTRKRTSQPSLAAATMRSSDKPIPLRPRPPKVKPPEPEVAQEALHPLAELGIAQDRDQVAHVCVKALSLVGERAIFFVVKKGVVQGWDGAASMGAVAGLSREALRNLWIPVTSRSVFREANEGRGTYRGPLTDSSADSILAAAIGGRPTSVVVMGVEVRGRVVAFLYVDGFEDLDDAAERMAQLADAAASALERLLLNARPGT
jgi:hypothetical protein